MNVSKMGFRTNQIARSPRCRGCQSGQYGEALSSLHRLNLHLKNNLTALLEVSLDAYSRQYICCQNTHVNGDLGAIRVLNGGVITLDPFVVDKLSYHKVKLLAIGLSDATAGCIGLVGWLFSRDGINSPVRQLLPTPPVRVSAVSGCASGTRRSKSSQLTMTREARATDLLQARQHGIRGWSHVSC